MTFMPIVAVMILLGFINVGMIVARVWSAEVGVVIGAAPIVLGIAAIAIADLIQWRRRQPRPLPRAVVIR